MFNLQGSEIIVILLLALVVLGPEKLPDAIRRFSRTYGELKKMGSGFQSELRSALDEPVNEMRKTADLVRDAADPDKIAAADAADQAAATADTAGERPEPAGDATGQPEVPQGDPPLVVGEDAPPADGGTRPDGTADDTDVEQADEPRRVNHIAAANSSGAIAAATDAAATDAAEATKPTGPAFHSAGPRSNGERSDAGGEAGGASGSEETSDEAATA